MTICLRIWIKHFNTCRELYVQRTYHFSFFILLALILKGCINPFAPGELDGDPFAELLGDPTTIDGFYQRFQSAYELRDTTLYGPLIHPEFVFSFRDEERNVDVTWNRPEEMNSTFNLFIQSADIQLNWNNYISISTNDENTRSQIVRRFDLGVLLTNSDLLRTDGSASFLLTRPDSTSNWQLLLWRDESEL